MFDLKIFSDGISLLGSVISTVKSVIDILPKQNKEEVSRKLQEAEEKLQIAQVQVAKGLGYELCKCTWPPQIMLHAGEVEYGEKFLCPACGRVVSPDVKNWRIGVKSLSLTLCCFSSPLTSSSTTVFPTS